MEWFKKLFYYAIVFLFGILILCGTIENGILMSIISFIFIYLFSLKVKIKNFPLFLILFCLITKILVIFILKTPLTGDFVLMYDTAKHIVSEGLFTLKHSYFNCWGYQLFHVLYESFILSILDSITFLKILNCIYSTISTVLIYMIVKKITNDKTARITSLLYAISFYPLYLNTILGNQQLGAMIALFGIYLFLYKKQSWKLLALVGILFGISHLERNEGVVYLLTSLIYLFFHFDNVKDLFKKIFVLVFCFLLVTKGTSFLIMKSGINDIGFGNANPEWKFLLGFNSTTNGKYDSNDEVYLGNLEAERQEIIKRVTDFKALPSLFYEKIKIQFLYDDFGDSFEDTNFSSFRKFKNFIFQYTKTINFIIILFAFLGIIKNPKIKKESLFFVINILLFFGIYLIIEICARYYYYPQITIIILSSLGIEKILHCIQTHYSLKSDIN